MAEAQSPSQAHRPYRGWHREVPAYSTNFSRKGVKFTVPMTVPMTPCPHDTLYNLGIMLQVLPIVSYKHVSGQGFNSIRLCP